MKIAVDTNVLLRAFLDDDEAQSKAAAETLQQATLIAVSPSSFCEFVWVLKSRYGATRTTIVGVVRALLDTENLSTNRGAIEAGLDVVAEGGDFADGVIAYEGAWLGGDTFVSFDKKAIAVVTKQGRKARLLLG